MSTPSEAKTQTQTITETNTFTDSFNKTINDVRNIADSGNIQIGDTALKGLSGGGATPAVNPLLLVGIVAIALIVLVIIRR